MRRRRSLSGTPIGGIPLIRPPRSPFPERVTALEENHLLRARMEADEARRLADAALALDTDRRLFTSNMQRAQMAADFAQVRDLRRAEQAAESWSIEQNRLRQQDGELQLMRQRQADDRYMLQERDRLDRQHLADELAVDRERHFVATQHQIAQIAKEREKHRHERNRQDFQHAERQVLAKFEAEEGMIRETKLRDNAIRLSNQENLELAHAETAKEVQISDEQRARQLKEDAALARRNAALAADETRKAQDSFARWERNQMAEEVDADRRKSALAKLEGEKAKLVERRNIDEHIRLSTPITADPLISQAIYPTVTSRLLSPTLYGSSIPPTLPSLSAGLLAPRTMYPSHLPHHYSTNMLGSRSPDPYMALGRDRLDHYHRNQLPSPLLIDDPLLSLPQPTSGMYRHPLDDPLNRYGIGVTEVGIPGVSPSLSRLKRDIMRSLPQ